MKKLLSIILCAIMLIATASSAFANEPINDNVNVGLEAYANEVIAEYIHISVETIDEADTFFLTQGYRVINNPDPNSRTFFLFQNGKCMGKLVATYVNGEYASSFTPYEIPAVTEAYENNEPFALALEGYSIMLITAEKAEIISGSDELFAEIEIADDLQTSNTEYSVIICSAIANTFYGDSVNVADNVILNLPHVSNYTFPNGTGLCWAASISSICAYQTNTSPMSALDLYNALDEMYVGTPMGFDLWEKRAFAYFDISAKYDTSLSFTQTATLLRADKPIYISLTDGNSHYHGVALCGYINVPNSTSYKYKLMDPNVSSYGTTYVISTNSNNFTYVGTYTYTTWRYSLYEY